MRRVAVLGGTGDAYLLCSLYAALVERHGPSVMMMKSSHLAVADLFPGVAAEAADAAVAAVEHNQALQRSHDNVLYGPPDHVFYAHPSFARSQVRVDQLTAKASLSQLDMYRAVLQLPPDAPDTRAVVPSVPRVPGSVLLIPEANSWPNTQPMFWEALAGRLRRDGWVVTVNDRNWTLGELLRRCAASEWVVGPQCGVMSILCSARFPCRKTLATPSIDGNENPYLWQRETYPYGYVTKFDGRDYDVEEFKISDESWRQAVELIATGVCAQAAAAHDPRPVTTVSVEMSPGDFLDRHAVMAVKRAAGAGRMAATDREYLRGVELLRKLLDAHPEATSGYRGLLRLHAESYAILERAVPDALGGGVVSEADHAELARLNRDRVRLRNVIDAACHAPYTEQKTYYQ